MAGNAIFTAVRPGDWLLTLLALILLGLLTWLSWGGGGADRVLIRSAGQPFAELSLHVPQRVQVPGPLGLTEIEIAQGVVRVAHDPGPRQLCVNQGWLSRAGQVALCLPNRVSIEVLGQDWQHDSLAY